MASMWPAVNDKMICDAFDAAPVLEPHKGDVIEPRLKFGRTIDS